MPEILLLTSFALSVCGFLLLALSLPRHWQEGPAEDCSLSGVSAYGSAATVFQWRVSPPFFRDGPAFGVLLWTLVSGVGALTVTLMLTVHRQVSEALHKANSTKRRSRRLSDPSPKEKSSAGGTAIRYGIGIRGVGEALSCCPVPGRAGLVAICMATELAELILRNSVTTIG